MYEFLIDDRYVPVVEKKISLYESMAQGYMEMGDINREISEAFNHAENEAETVTTKLITGAYND